MPVYHPPKIASSEITPKSLYLKRRQFMGVVAGGIAAAGLGSPALAAPLAAKPSIYTLDEKLTSKEDVTTTTSMSSALARKIRRAMQDHSPRGLGRSKWADWSPSRR